MRVFRVLVACVACSGPNLVSAPMLGPQERAATETTAGAPEDVTGSWSGRGLQSNGSTWQLQVTFEKPRGESLVGHASYPDQACTADWTLHAEGLGLWE